MPFLASFIAVRLLLWQPQDGKYCLKLNADMSKWDTFCLGVAFLACIKLFPENDWKPESALVWRNTWQVLSDKIDLASEAYIAWSRSCDQRTPINNGSVTDLLRFNPPRLAPLQKIYRTIRSLRLICFCDRPHCRKLYSVNSSCTKPKPERNSISTSRNST